MEYMLTGKLAKDTDTHPETIRYYLREGLIPDPPRNRDGYKMFPLSTAKRIQFIKAAREVGYSIDELKDLLNLENGLSHELEDVIEKQLRKIKCRYYAIYQVELALRKMLQACKRGRCEQSLSVADYAFDTGASV